MTTTVAGAIDRDRLGGMAKISQGGQGVVYAAPAVRTAFTPHMVYKEYRPEVLAQLDGAALAAMPVFLESLPAAAGRRMINLSAWPCAIVEKNGSPTGFVMPRIPDEFFVSITTVKGVSRQMAELQHILNPVDILRQRGLLVSEVERYSLLRSVADNLDFLHTHGVVVGDLSPKNLLFSLDRSHPHSYFIDCDAMRVGGRSVMPQLETPGWSVPAGEELATPQSDSYKLGLLALRLLVAEQDVTDPRMLPAFVTPMLRQLVTDTLTRPARQRPGPAVWDRVLVQAVRAAHVRQGMTR
ncbi:hypothetical protein [Tsukamurella soli]|uniref:Protein kinase domain-containing protein n=1 Tax=Tsukamurella soli TaxID=644556 RepID=A0ABP8JQ45_9ACTN